MRLKKIAFAFFILLSTTSFGQFKKVIFRDTTLSFDGYNLYLVDFVASPTELKFKIRILNKSNDFIQYRPEQSSFIVDGQKSAVEADLIVVGPNETKNKVVRLVGSGYNSIRNFGFNLAGLYKVKPSSPLIVEQFRLPAAENSFDAGPFHVDLKKVVKTTQKTEVLFQVSYRGESDFGLVYASNVSVLMPDGKTYANLKTRYKYEAVGPDKPIDFYAVWEKMPGGSLNDMQKVDMYIQFQKVFKEVTTEAIDEIQFDFQYDDQLTRAAN